MLDFYYDSASDETDRTLLICAGGQWALLNHDLQTVIEIDDELARGLDSSPPSGRGGLWRFRSETDHWGFIDVQGNVLIKPRYHRASNFAEELAAASLPSNPKEFGFISPKGDWAIGPGYSFCHSFSEGFAVVRDGSGRRAFIDRLGNLKTAHQYEQAGSFSEKMAWVLIPEADAQARSIDNDCRVGYIDNGMALKISPQFYLGGNFSAGVAAVAKKTGDYHRCEDEICVPLQWGICDPQARIFWTNYSFIGEYSDGLCPVAVGGHYSVEGFHVGGRWGFVDEEYKEVIKCAYAFVEPFQDGLARVGTEENDIKKPWLWGTHYLNKAGQTVFANQ